MIVQHNMAAANTNRQLGITTGQLSKSTEKLSSGYRINRAGDDAAGLSISEKMRGQIRGLEQASTNAQDGISMIQTAEGALNETHSILQRMRELTVQAANDTNVTTDRNSIKEELTALTCEVSRIAKQTEFNTMKLLSGKMDAKYLQVGANKGQNIKFTIKSVTAGALSITNVANNVSSYSVATKQLSTLDAAIKSVSSTRSKLGALQNRLEHTIANADNTAENLQAAESRIRDVDMASEMVKYSKSNILQQAAQSMLAQANQSTQGVLSILG
nr:flagellin [uncultured Anaerosporobacter sp.]